MRMPCTIVRREKLAHYGLATQCREGNGRDKLLTGIGYHHLNFCPLPYQQTQNKTGLVGGDAARNAQYDFLSFQHVLLKLLKGKPTLAATKTL